MVGPVADLEGEGGGGGGLKEEKPAKQVNQNRPLPP